VIPIVTPAEARALDAASPVPVERLVERAGAAVAREAIAMLGGTYGRVVHVIAGPGNNGADGRVAADRLAQRGVRVRVHAADSCPPSLPPADLVIDAAYGTGFRGTWKPPDTGGAPVLAVDVPSGIDALTGAAPGPVLPAAATVTFAAVKPGLLFGSGRSSAGRVVVADIGLDVSATRAHVVEAADVAAWVPSRRRDAHKWNHALRVVAGSPGMAGAAHLVCAAAQRTAAGIVHLSSPGGDAAGPVETVVRRLPPFDWHEAVLADVHRFGALVIGPGLGREEHTIRPVVDVVERCIMPVVVDGDGLFAIAWNEQGAPTVLRGRDGSTVITPHDGEYTLLTGAPPGADRIDAARRLAVDTGAVVLLKGPVTVVAAPEGDVRVVANGDQRLATAGSGDVLSGIVGALITTGMAPFDAAAAGAWIHGDAGARCAAVGVVAGDLVSVLPTVMSELDR
jgi:NAD(P)H-hydrate epimerase